MVHAEILRGVRGPRGGYRLAKERRRITVADIVAVVHEMEGGRDPLTDPAGSELGHTVLRPIWQEIEEYAMETLSKKTVEDLCVAAQRAGIESQSQNQFDFMI